MYQGSNQATEAQDSWFTQVQWYRGKSTVLIPDLSDSQTHCPLPTHGYMLTLVKKPSPWLAKVVSVDRKLKVRLTAALRELRRGIPIFIP